MATSSVVIPQAEHRILPWNLAYKWLRHRWSFPKQNTAFFPGISPTNGYVIGGHSPSRTPHSSLGSRLQMATSSAVIPQAEHRILPWDLAYKWLRHRRSFPKQNTAFFPGISPTNRYVIGGHSTCRTQHSSQGSRLQIATSSAVIHHTDHRILP